VVPIVGPLALGIIAVLVASFHSWQSALAVAGFLAAYRILHDYVIYPRLLSEGVEIHPVAIILAVLCGAELGGVTGVFLSVPVVALLIVCWRHWHGLQADRANPILAPDGSQMVERLNVEVMIVEE
jgi:predicted PurR-regulated permease PerM